ncbi:monovalent cation:proton antiporter-2 (CPA2) family protein [Marinobacter sp. CHS3-4]|uniref:monovalent cation:proton antiporter-2 (CPA2) family protein n=1 Tax=Marinobacter sp. CHS3-4 TaxID=3045174 RepID=UPI0024B55BED|nr:monovalent cation:proton antiporter-2 (CPA2) family protein [Marinobacter sp. CHS3-4]MDI9246058.1 monovalent cation:proton antiporter-2 (CPA2) family protein [Marinobacter sp. CHS3-4]
MTAYFVQAFIYLAAAVIAVPLAKRFGLGSVLGYLVAGVVIGPVTGLVGQETTTIQHFAEFGVVMMLFLVGMELDPKALWAMRARLLGLGGLQVSLTALAGMAFALWLGLVWQTALTVGFVFALSSTAIVLQTLNEKGLARTEGGRSAFSVLLFQDIAVIPMLAIIPLLALPGLMDTSASSGSHSADLSLVDGLPVWAHGGVVVLAVALVIVGGYFLSRPLFRYVVQSGLREVFTATALMLVIGIAALMSLVNLSPALGAFLAGVVLANSEFRHELEANIEPFKGLLLGLFFITVGAGINFDVLAQQWGVVLSLAAVVLLVKALILLGLALLFRIKGSNGWLFTLGLAQAGEFGFVLLTYAVQNQVIPVDLSQVLSLVVALSMFLTPALFILYDQVVLPRYRRRTNEPEADSIDEAAPVIVAGVGRFGQIVCRLLRANNIPIVVLDHEIQQIENVRRIQIKSYFGDASRPELLETAGIAQARLLVVAIDDRERSVKMVEHVKKFYPGVWVLARAFDRGHGYQLRGAGADDVVRETYHSALELGGHALTAMGVHPLRAKQMTWAFYDNESAHEDELYEAWQEIEEGISFSPRYGELFMKLEEALSSAMQTDWDDPKREDVPVWTPPQSEPD